LLGGWRAVHREYWGRPRGEGRLVTSGLYSYMRHPQYTGFILLTLGLLLHWATLPLLVMWPLLVWQYVRLAKAEEEEMVEEFGQEYLEYMERTPRFLPSLTKLLETHTTKR